ncbi:Site-specific recombinase XerD [Peptoniphilus asaccharolyticus DSM 20463]|uniref:Site-specific recombinase XerD n=1 Tax=Peptoniphilus asaccharolyticus DSM 20463 TaxID=573058 RepID=A0A1W1VAT9_PEPAS|nr:site-specific integrase [Peptoniphilus asaccharolyticus]MBL7575764.1 site-specific integrase [Peptoniphilus asaccharolyticus]SMB90084.1 Site-specific recombinase XerD [Peptoniphilus asaccharolyticus DSM 20463]
MPSKRMPSNSSKWYCSFYYTDYQGNRKRKKKEGFETKKQAEEWERDFLNNIDLSPSMTFQTLTDKYMEDIKPRCKINTITTKNTYLQAHILPYFKDLKINDINPLIIREWQNIKLTELSPVTNKPYSPTYLKSLNTLLSAILNYGVKFHNLKENPCLKTGSIGSLKSDKDIQIWSIEEFNQFINVIDRSELHLGFNILYWSGLRIGELLALKWSDIDSERNILNIDESYQRIKKEDIITNPKSKKSIRKIVIIQSVIDELLEYKKKIYSPADDERIFPFQKRVFEKAIKKYSKLAKIKTIRVHDLRHSHASLLIHNGINIVSISNRLGHEKVSTTLNIYAHLFNSSDDNLIKALEEEAAKKTSIF